MSVKMKVIAWECAAESPVQRLLLVKLADASADFISKVDLSDQNIRSLALACATSEGAILKQVRALKRKSIIFCGRPMHGEELGWYIDFHAVRRVLGGGE
ncbi:MAG: hypothetical protein ACRC0U_00895 [Vibrio sp.]